MQIETIRLRILACSVEVADALGSDRARAERLLDARLPNDWPDEELAEQLPAHARVLRADPKALGYGIWLLVDRRHSLLVGSAGFLGTPTSEGAVELGYGVHPEHRSRGYATEAARALIAWALAQEGVARVTARCRPGNVASLRVLTKAGLARTSELDGLTHWVSRDPVSARV